MVTYLVLTEIEITCLDWLCLTVECGSFELNALNIFISAYRVKFESENHVVDLSYGRLAYVF